MASARAVAGPVPTHGLRQFYRDLAGAEAQTPLGAHIASLLARAPPRSRPAWISQQLHSWLTRMTYFNCKARAPLVPQLCAAARLHTVQPGQVIARQAAYVSEFHILLSGQCSVHLNSLNPPTGTLSTLSALSRLPKR